MLRTTFYSYKGGVGRTLALLNVASMLAMNGSKVVAVDLDLEAPGFGLSSLTKRPEETPHLGVSDFLFASRVPGPLTAEPYIVRPKLPEVEDRLLLMPTGTRAMELAGRVGEFYRDPASDAASAFEVLVAEIEERFAPDYLFFDSRTGLADIAGVCTVELPQVLVVFSGLNEQNVNGTARVLSMLRDHPARERPVATMLVLSPIPRAADVRVPTLRETARVRPGGGVEIGVERESNLLTDAIFRAQSRLFSPILQDFPEVQKWFPNLRESDLLHGLEYDPEVPLRDELHLRRSCPLAEQYRSLARSISRANLEKSKVLSNGGEESLLPWLVDHVA